MACIRQSIPSGDRKSTRLNSSHTEIYTLSLHDALPILIVAVGVGRPFRAQGDLEERHWLQVNGVYPSVDPFWRSEEHTSELQSHRDLHSFPTRRSSDLDRRCGRRPSVPGSGRLGGATLAAGEWRVSVSRSLL